MPKDQEHNAFEVHYITGYPSLAAFIASDRDRSTHIYRRFDRLATRNILYLQSELAELEDQQDKYDAEDLKRTTQEKKSAGNWRVFKEKASEPGDVKEKARMELVKEIEEKIKRYQKAIVLQSTLLSLGTPSTRVVEAFRNESHNVGGPEGSFSTLGGSSSRILNNSDDLMALHKEVEEDRLTSFLRYYFSVLFVSRRTDHSLAYASERRLHITVTVLNVILAAVLLFGAIYNLYYVIDQKKRLGLIAGYTITFAICVGLVTNARRSEVFTACAAYAAVLVVFVSGNLGTPSTGKT